MCLMSASVSRFQRLVDELAVERSIEAIVFSAMDIRPHTSVFPDAAGNIAG